ncbi:MAG: hypothetical protein LBJ11_01170 [Oscillospiraceae bacterium]|nr:hypothetical protein [Oscillospiraceae bacterium]
MPFPLGGQWNPDAEPRVGAGPRAVVGGLVAWAAEKEAADEETRAEEGGANDGAREGCRVGAAERNDSSAGPESSGAVTVSAALSP